MEKIPIEIIKEFLKYLNKADNYVLLFVCKKIALIVGKQENKLIMDEIIKYGSVNQLLWFESLGNKYDRDKICKISVTGGNLEVLKYAHKNGYHWNKNTCNYAALNGQLECLKYAHENKCPWNIDTCTYASINGHLECLKYAHDNKCPWNKETCRNAAANGHLDCLKYAHENGCPWNKDTCSNAAKYGHLDCLKYAHENGCPAGDKRMIFSAAKNDHLHIIQYCYDNGFVWSGYEIFRDRNGNGIILH